MRNECEKYWVLKNKHGDTYIHYREDGSRIDCWCNARTAERFDTEEEAARFLKTEIEYPHDFWPVCVTDRMDASDDEEPCDAVTRIEAVLRRYYEWDWDTEEPNAEFDPDLRAEEAIDEILKIVRGC